MCKDDGAGVPTSAFTSSWVPAVFGDQFCSAIVSSMWSSSGMADSLQDA